MVSIARILGSLGLLVLASAMILGQEITSGLRGIVSDPRGAVIPGAEITVLNESTGFTRTVTTDEGGRYVFTLLPVGDYTLTAKKGGFKEFQSKGIKLILNQVAGINP